MQKTVVQKIELPELTDTISSAGATLNLPLPFLGNMKVSLAVRVGTLSITIDKLQSIKENEVLTLDNALSEPVDVIVDGHIIARGKLVAAGDNFGVQLTELLLPNPKNSTQS